MKSIRSKLVIIYLILVFIVMLISGTFIIMRIKSQETSKIESELKAYAMYIEEQLIKQYETPEDFQQGFSDLFIYNSSTKNIQGNILNSDGKTIASTSTTENSNYLDFKNSVVISALSGKENFSFSEKSIDTTSQVKDWLSFGYPVFGDNGIVEYVIYVQMDANGIKHSLSQTTSTIMISVFLALLLTIILGNLFSNTITSPISLLTRKANLLAKGHLEQNILVKSNDEIGQLTKSFNHMARELRKTVSDMENENNKLEIVLHNITDGILAFDANRALIHANKIFYDLLGIDKNISYINFDWLLQKTKLSRSDFKNNEIKEVQISENNKFINISFIPYSTKDKIINGGGIVVVFQDITKHTKLDNMRKEFVANVSHEIRTPITTIKSYAETLIEGALDDKEIAIDFLNTIIEAGDRMQLLTDDLLELSRLDGKKITFKFEKENLYELVLSCVKQHIITAQKKNQKLTLHEPKNKELFIYVDRSRINQVLNNIISNSMKYSLENTEIDIYFTKTENGYDLEISDNGIGIPKEDLARIFERFYRVDKARSRSMGGNGLGLSIALEIMQEHGGDIKAFSQVGVGTTMLLKFPFCDDFQELNMNNI